MLSVERDRIPTLERLGLYVAPAALVAHPVRVGSRGRIELMDRAGSSVELYSTREADVDDPELIAEITFPDRDGLEPGSGVRVLWVADVYDLRFRGDNGAELPSSTDSSSAVLRPTALRSARFELVGNRSLWTLEIASEHVSLPMELTTVMEPGGVLRELTRLLAGRDSVRPLRAVSVVARYAGFPAGTWAVEIGAVLGDSRATAEIADGRLVLRVAFDWTGLPAREISMCVEDEGRPIEGAVFAEISAAADCLSYHATAWMELPSATFAGAATTLAVAPLIDHIPMTRMAVIVPDEPVTTDGIPAELKRMLADYDERSARHACRRAAVIFVRFARERGSAPLDADRCAARVGRLFAEVDCAGAASATIRTIGMLLADSVHVPAIRPPLSGEFSDFGLTVNEVIMDVLQREENLGQLLPESIDELRRAAELQRCAATLDNALNRRLEVLARTCERFTPH
jgi:hypothetical protein